MMEWALLPLPTGFPCALWQCRRVAPTGSVGRQGGQCGCGSERPFSLRATHFAAKRALSHRACGWLRLVALGWHLSDRQSGDVDE